ncbi:3,4-dihydroxy-2-butanone 4-phosphate synthase, partial [Blyttiomyces helicus]
STVRGGKEYEFDSIEDAIQDMQAGKFVVVVDNEDRENEGDLIIAGEHLTPEKAAFMIRYTSGMICVACEGEICDRLELPPMVEKNTESLRTAYTVSCDYNIGTTTGISAADRSATTRALADPSTLASALSRPGHVFPLRYTPGGVLKRVGHTEAAVDLCKLAGLRPAGALCEVALDDGTMARRPDLEIFARRWGLKLITISDIIKYRVRKGLVDEGF